MLKEEVRHSHSVYRTQFNEIAATFLLISALQRVASTVKSVIEGRKGASTDINQEEALLRGAQEHPQILIRRSAADHSHEESCISGVCGRLEFEPTEILRQLEVKP